MFTGQAYQEHIPGWRLWIATSNPLRHTYPTTHTLTANMEFSSPLAAMRPQPCPAWGNRRDLPLPRAMYSGCSTLTAPSTFDFRNMSMHQQPSRPVQKDYFNLRPARGSSPTSSLTADLDANFHIDQRYALSTRIPRLHVLELCSPWQQPAGSHAEALVVHCSCLQTGGGLW